MSASRSFRSRRRTWGAVVTLALSGLLGALPASAHRLAPSLLDVRAVADGSLEVLWKTPLARPAGVELRPELPEGCLALGVPEADGDAGAAQLRFRAACGPGGLVGRSFGVAGLAESGTEALLRLELPDGRRFATVLRADAPSFTVPVRQGWLEVARSYAWLGVRHILGGADHLLFVLALLLLVRGVRLVVATLTAFTVGHSLTLSLAALGFVGLPQAPVELAIAASILVLAAELVREEARPSLLRRYPWAVAGLFGLLHGLGFAGALAEAGLPAGEIPAALVAFNLGIELGQLVFVAVVLAGVHLLRGSVHRAPVWLARAPVYAIGGLAAYFCIDRAAALL